MRLVFIHGINEDHKKPLALRRKWQRALHSAWDAAGLSRPHYKLEMPYYGDLLADLVEPHTHRPTHDGHVHMPHLLSKTGQRMLHDVGKLLCVNKKKLANEIVRSDVAGSEWVQAVLSALDSDVPGFSPLLLRFVRQVDAYLKSPKIRTAVDNLIRPSLLMAPPWSLPIPWAPSSPIGFYARLKRRLRYPSWSRSARLSASAPSRSI